MNYREALAALAFASAIVCATPVAAQATLSEQLVRQIEEAQKAARQRKFDQAAALFSRAVGAAAGDRTNMRLILKSRASIYEEMHEFAAAEADLTSALAVQPVDPDLFADRGYFYMRQNRMPDALGDFLAGARLAPKNPRFYFGAGRVQAALSNYTSAIDFYSDAIAADPLAAGAFLARAEARVRLGRWAEARADYDRAIALGMTRPGDAYFARLGRGYVQLMLGQYTPAVADLDRALDIEPKSVKALLWHGYANEKRGRADLALNAYERAVAADPEDAPARRNVRRLRSRDPSP